MTRIVRGRSIERRRAGAWLGLLALVTLGSIAYSGVLHAPFAFDDQRNLLENPAIRWQEVDLDSFRAAVFESPSNRPVANLTFALNYRVGGYEVSGYRLVNVVVHLLNALLVQFFARTTFRRVGGLGPNIAERAAWFAALLFLVHPLQVQSVTYVIQRMNSLSTFFYLSALLLYIRGREKPPGSARHIPYAGAVVSGLLALGCKQNAITLPVAVWLYEAFFFRDLDRAWMKRSAVRLAVPLVLVGGAIYSVLVYGPDLGYARRDFTLGERLLTQPRVVAAYAGLMAFPHPARLSLIHEVEVSTSLVEPLTTLLAILGLCAGVGFAVGWARSRPLLSFGVFWFMLQLVVESSVLPLEMMYEHRTYLPLVGVCLAFAHVWYSWIAKTPARVRVADGLAIVVTLALTLGTLERNRVWLTAESLWADALSKNPGSVRAQSNLGTALAMAGRFDESEGHQLAALAIAPDFFEAHMNLARLYLHQGRAGEAQRHLERALETRGADPEVLADLGAAFAQLGRSEEAAVAFETALDLAPDHRRSRYNYGLMLLGTNQFEEASRQLVEAARIEPGRPETHMFLARAFAGLGRRDEAIRQYQEVLRLVPQHGGARADLELLVREMPSRSSGDAPPVERPPQSTRSDTGAIPRR
ncbi:tetratricopeptide repeat protein [Myxococcota bacterium]|nr:tetratricopeptide repeat protein [Myxococcota bacterium]